MSFEIERKFLVAGDGWRAQVKDRIALRQAYLTFDGKASIRVRIRDNDGATLTIKSRGAERRRLELEYPVPVLEAEALIALRRGSVIEKVRHLVPHAGATWEVDVFDGENSGLVIAEIELRDEHQIVELPPWVGPEVTGQPQYYNSSLAQRPYRSWPETRGTAAAKS
ncbi:MAG TPA: CYTH domain-containing protein [Hyphomicrobiaceae bacterium]|nr:CYTH domain-containing protein [Hyphomicrobiaceae bacterium]